MIPYLLVSIPSSSFFLYRCLLENLFVESNISVHWSKMCHPRLRENSNFSSTNAQCWRLGMCSINWSAWNSITKGNIYVPCAAAIKVIWQPCRDKNHLTRNDKVFSSFSFVLAGDQRNEVFGRWNCCIE